MKSCNFADAASPVVKLNNDDDDEKETTIAQAQKTMAQAGETMTQALTMTVTTALQ